MDKGVLHIKKQLCREELNIPHQCYSDQLISGSCASQIFFNPGKSFFRKKFKLQTMYMQNVALISVLVQTYTPKLL